LAVTLAGCGGGSSDTSMMTSGSSGATMQTGSVPVLRWCRRQAAAT
jgi:hypothetical protein